jgi:hypothetical protein
VAKTAAEAIGPDAKLDPVFARALREAIFWLLAALALVLFISLASFDPGDRSPIYTGEPGQVGNLIGPFGAWIASVLLLIFGWPAFLFPVAIAYSAWAGLKRLPGEKGQGRSTIALRVTGLVPRSQRVAALRRCISPQACCRRARVQAESSAACSAMALRNSHRPSVQHSSFFRSGSSACSSTRAFPGSR